MNRIFKTNASVDICYSRNNKKWDVLTLLWCNSLQQNFVDFFSFFLFFLEKKRRRILLAHLTFRGFSFFSIRALIHYHLDVIKSFGILHCWLSYIGHTAVIGSNFPKNVCRVSYFHIWQVLHHSSLLFWSILWIFCTSSLSFHHIECQCCHFEILLHIRLVVDLFQTSCELFIGNIGWQKVRIGLVQPEKLKKYTHFRYFN